MPPRGLQHDADYKVHETNEFQSTDYEDHTFSGIMFSVEPTPSSTVAALFIESVAVRGELGPMTVWTKRGGWREHREDPTAWRLVYKHTLEPSRKVLQALTFDAPLAVLPGERVSLYIHSALPYDTGVVYDNVRPCRGQKFLTVHPGCAHLACEPFSGRHRWGAWRDHRVFVGRITYGVRHVLWRPQVHRKFPVGFRNMVHALCLMRTRHPFNLLSEDLIFYLIHMCPADWCPPAGSRNRRSVAAKARGMRPLFARIATLFFSSD